MTDSTLFFDLGQPGVKARLWSAAFAGGADPSEYGPGAWDERMSTPEGTIGFQRVPEGRTVVYFSKDGYQSQTFPTKMPDDGVKIITLVKVPKTLLRLHVEGRHFYDSNGQRLDLVLADSFQAMDRFETGEDLAPVFRQLQDERFNGIRVLFTDKAIPKQIGRPTYRANPEHAAAFFHYAALFDLYVLGVVFADGVVPEAEQLSYFDAMVQAQRQSSNTIGSLVNEYTEHENFVDRSKFPRPNGVAFSSGSAGSDIPTAPPHWDFDEFHPRRDRPNSIKDCCVVDHPNYINRGLGILIDEPDRFGSQGNPDAEYCALQAGASVESAMGICFHSKCGVYAVPMDDETLRCARAFIAALKGF